MTLSWNTPRRSWTNQRLGTTEVRIPVVAEYRSPYSEDSSIYVRRKNRSPFSDTLELLFRAQYAKPETKVQYLVAVIGKTDLLKFFLQIGWENRLLDERKYIDLSQELQEVGRMLGGWRKGLEAKLPPKR